MCIAFPRSMNVLACVISLFTFIIFVSFLFPALFFFNLRGWTFSSMIAVRWIYLLLGLSISSEAFINVSFRGSERKFHRVWYFGFFFAIDRICYFFLFDIFSRFCTKGHFGYSCGSNAIKINTFSGQTLSFLRSANGDFASFFFNSTGGDNNGQMRFSFALRLFIRSFVRSCVVYMCLCDLPDSIHPETLS